MARSPLRAALATATSCLLLTPDPPFPCNWPWRIFTLIMALHFRVVQKPGRTPRHCRPLRQQSGLPPRLPSEANPHWLQLSCKVFHRHCGPGCFQCFDRKNTGISFNPFELHQQCTTSFKYDEIQHCGLRRRSLIDEHSICVQTTHLKKHLGTGYAPSYDNCCIV